MEQKFTIELNVQELQGIMGLLMKCPFEQVAGLITNIERQMQAQNQPTVPLETANDNTDTPTAPAAKKGRK